MSYDFECNSESERCKYDREKDRKSTSKKIISKKEDSDIDGLFLTEVHRSNFFYYKTIYYFRNVLNY